MRVCGSQLADGEATESSDKDVYTGSVYAMYMGILILFGIMWTIYFFLYCWQYDSFGNYSFFVSSYIVSLNFNLMRLIRLKFSSRIRFLSFSSRWACRNISPAAY